MFKQVEILLHITALHAENICSLIYTQGDCDLADNTVFDFNELVNTIVEVHEQLTANAVKAVNVALTLRNWLIGFHIREFELNGSDRVVYGSRMLDHLAEQLRRKGLRRVDVRELRRYHKFYQTFPQIRESLSPEFTKDLFSSSPTYTGLQSETCTDPFIDGKTMLHKLSFSHLVELMKISSEQRRSFYAIECIKGNWSVRELKRQITSLYHERSILSRNKTALSRHTERSSEKNTVQVAIRDPYIFEFLGMKSKEVMREKDLESALLEKLKEFLLELGHGFCLEGRNKRILIGDEYYFVDLVFYHRLLKCHVLLELKVDAFRHEHLSQLNTYLTYYRLHEMGDDDNPPIGILLCTENNHTLVEYALAGLDTNIFVSRYLLELPEREIIKDFLEKQLMEMSDSDV